MIPISYFMGWLSSVVYVSALSLWALVSGHWAAWQAARVEVVQEQQAEAERTYPLEDRVADRVMETAARGRRGRGLRVRAGERPALARSSGSRRRSSAHHSLEGSGTSPLPDSAG